MNAVEIEQAVSELAEQPFDPVEFPYAFLMAFGNKDTTIIHIVFLHGTDLYLYDHDALVSFMEANAKIGADSVSWHQQGFRTWPSPPAWAITYLNDFRISQ